MRTRTRLSVMVAVSLVVVTILVILFTGSGSVIPNNKPHTSEPMTTTTPKTTQRVAAILLIKTSKTETYVELTEEELEQFPALQAALRALEASGGSEIKYRTSKSAATTPMYYLEEKYCGQKPCVWNHIFKYGENFYLIAVELP